MPTSPSCRPKARSSPRARPRRWRIEAFAPLLPELIGGSADLAHSNLTLWKGSKSVASRRSQRQLHLLRRARVRDDRDQQRPGPARVLHPVRRDLPGVQRLRAQRRAHERADGRARDPRLHARLDRPGRGRPDPPADRAPGLAALHPQQRRVASVRRGRVGGVLEARRSSATTARAAWSSRARTCAHQPRSDAAGRRHRARRLRAAAIRQRRAGADPDRDRLGSRPRRCRPPRSCGDKRARGVDAVDRRVRPPGRRVPRSRCCRRPAASASPSKPASPTSGASTSASTAR